MSPSTVSRGLKSYPHLRKETVARIKAAAMEISEMAATSLIEKLKNPYTDSLPAIVLKYRLVIRESSIRARESGRKHACCTFRHFRKEIYLINMKNLKIHWDIIKT